MRRALRVHALLAALALAACALPSDPTPATTRRPDAVRDTDDAGAPSERDAGPVESDAGSRAGDAAVCFGCAIAGTCHADGASHPSDPCLVCDVARALDGWSVATGRACGAASECASAGVCSAQGTCVARPIEQGTHCGASDTTCATSSCDGRGACVVRPAKAGTACGESALCMDAPACDGLGSCLPARPLPQGASCSHGTCDGEPQASCVCAAGFTPGAAGCHDIDECAEQIDDCDHGPAACQNSEGSFECACPAGFQGTGRGVRGCQCERSDWSPLCAPWTQVSVKLGHGCALSAGALFCWGANDQGQLGLDDTVDRNVPTRVGNARDWTQVDVGHQHSCGLRAGGLYCWGSNYAYGAGQSDGTRLLTPTRVGSASDWQRVTLGDSFGCGLRTSGALYCWGSSAYGQTTLDSSRSMPTRVDALDVVAEVQTFSDTTCALSHGRVYCWGDGFYSQLGHGTGATSSTPLQVDDSADYVTLDVGANHVCALRNDGSLWCWGQYISNAPKLVLAATDDSIEQISAGNDFRCVRRKSGAAECQGNAQDGRLGTGGIFQVDAFTSLSPEGNFDDLAAGDQSGCAIRDGALLCWGSNRRGNAALSFLPQPVNGAEDWLEVSAGSSHSCGIRSPGILYCWGGFQINNPRPADVPYYQPVRIGSADDWTAIGVGEGYSCGLRGAGELYCWGKNLYGRLGLGGGDQANEPTRVGSFDDWTQVATYDDHTCAIRGADGRLYCWGSDQSHAIGDDSPLMHVRPTLIGEPGYTQVTVGATYTCAVRDGQPYCWGTDVSGALGGSAYVAKPFQVKLGGKVTAVFASLDHTLAIGSDGGFWAWGSDGGGRLGLGGMVGDVRPTFELGQHTLESVGLGLGHSCALLDGGHLYCWGDNSQGQLGTGDSQGRPVVTQVSTDGGFFRISARADRSCAIRSSDPPAPAASQPARPAGALYCWGDNGQGQLGHARGLRPWPVENINDRE